MYCILWKPKQKYVSSYKGLSVLKAISAYFSTLLSNCISPICRHKPPFVVVPSSQIKGMEENKGFSDKFLDVPLIYVTSLLCNNYLTLLYLPHFVIKMPHFVVDVPFCSRDFLLCSKLHTPFSPIL